MLELVLLVPFPPESAPGAGLGGWTQGWERQGPKEMLGRLSLQGMDSSSVLDLMRAGVKE